MFWRGNATAAQRTAAQESHNDWLRSQREQYNDRTSQAASLRSVNEESSRFSTGSDVSLEEAINTHEAAERLHTNFQRGLELEEDYAAGPVYRSLNPAALGLLGNEEEEEPERPVYRSMPQEVAARPGGGRNSIGDPSHAAEAAWLAGPNPPLLSRQRAQSWHPRSDAQWAGSS